jgi:peptidyl-prolyl cis-trans isomerase C
MQRPCENFLISGSNDFQATTGIMFDMLTSRRVHLIRLLIFVFLLSACSNQQTAVVETATQVASTASPTPDVPTPTPTPAAAIVNGERISLSWYKNEVERYLIAQEAMGQPVEDEGAAREIVLNDLIEQVLLAQGAQEAGLSVSDEEVQARIDDLAAEYDLAAWMAEWGYTVEDLFTSMKLQIMAAYQRDLVADSVPEIAEQVQLQQIFTYAEADAKSALVSLNSGADFNELAFSVYYDPTTGGYLGWVPRGYLLDPAVEEAAFSLPVGSYSDIIETEAGYHIILVIAREDRSLSSDAMLILQRKAVVDWVEERWGNSVIEIPVE